MTTIKVDIPNLRAIERVFNQAPQRMTHELGKAIDRVGYSIEARAKREAPINKEGGGGNLRQSISYRKTGVASGVIKAGASYAAAVHEGTRPHIITVRKKRVLANKRKGIIFGRSVKHPGTSPNPFMERAVDANRGTINSQFTNALTRALS